MKKTKRTRAGSEAQYAPRLAGEILKDYLENSNEPFARAYRAHTSEVEVEEQGWHANTDLGCDLKTLLRHDKRVKTGKEYPGVLRRDSDAVVDEFLSLDAHYTFIESTALSTAERRNVRLYEGRHITCTKRLNGTARLNFKELKQDAYENVDNYAFEVANEIREALKGFVGE